MPFHPLLDKLGKFITNTELAEKLRKHQFRKGSLTTFCLFLIATLTIWMSIPTLVFPSADEVQDTVSDIVNMLSLSISHPREAGKLIHYLKTHKDVALWLFSHSELLDKIMGKKIFTISLNPEILELLMVTSSSDPETFDRLVEDAETMKSLSDWLTDHPEYVDLLKERPSLLRVLIENDFDENALASWIIILFPFENMTFLCSVFLNATAYSPFGIRRMEATWLSSLGSGVIVEVNGEALTTIWETRGLPPGEYSIIVRAVTENDKVLVDNVKIYLVTQAPSIEILAPMNYTMQSGNFMVVSRTSSITPINITTVTLMNLTNAFTYNLTDPDSDGLYTTVLCSEVFDDGNYSLTAFVMDRYGLTNSSSVYIYLSNLLEVNITYPLENEELSGIFNVTVEVPRFERASSGFISLNGLQDSYVFDLIGPDVDGVFFVCVDSTKIVDGFYVLSAHIVEVDGSFSHGKEIPLRLLNSPQVSILSPKEGDVLDGTLQVVVDIQSFEPLNETNLTLSNTTASFTYALRCLNESTLYSANISSTALCDGDYVLSAYAMDIDSSINSSQILIEIDNVPDPVLISPLNGEFLEGEFTIMARVTSMDSITQITGYIDSTFIGNLAETEEPDVYSLNIDSRLFSEFFHDISVTVLDEQGFSNSTLVHLVMVDNFPSNISIVKPLNGMTIFGDIMSVRASIQDFVDVTRIYINGVPMDLKRFNNAYVDYVEFEVDVSEIIVNTLTVTVWYQSALGHQNMTTICTLSNSKMLRLE